MIKCNKKKLSLVAIIVLFIVSFSIFSNIKANKSNYTLKIKTSSIISYPYFSNTEVLDHGEHAKAYTDWLYPWKYISWSFSSSNKNVSIKVMLMDLDNYWDYHYGRDYSHEAILSDNKISDSGNVYLQFYNTTYYVVFLNNNTSEATTLTWTVAIKLNIMFLLPFIILILVGLIVAFSLITLYYYHRKKRKYSLKQKIILLSEQARRDSSSRIINEKALFNISPPIQTQNQVVTSKKVSQEIQIRSHQDIKPLEPIKPSEVCCQFCGKKIMNNTIICQNCGTIVKKKN